MSCQIKTNQYGKVTEVLAPNGQESKLFKSILNSPYVSNVDDALHIYLSAINTQIESEKTLVTDINSEPLIVYSVNKAFGDKELFFADFETADKVPTHSNDLYFGLLYKPEQEREELGLVYPKSSFIPLASIGYTPTPNKANDFFYKMIRDGIGRIERSMNPNVLFDTQLFDIRNTTYAVSDTKFGDSVVLNKADKTNVAGVGISKPAILSAQRFDNMQNIILNTSKTSFDNNKYFTSGSIPRLSTEWNKSALTDEGKKQLDSLVEQSFKNRGFDSIVAGDTLIVFDKNDLTIEQGKTFVPQEIKNKNVNSQNGTNKTKPEESNTTTFQQRKEANTEGANTNARNEAKRTEVKSTLTKLRDEGLLKTADKTLIGKAKKLLGVKSAPMSDAEIDAQMALMDAMSDVWRKTTGKDNFYETFIADIKKGDISELNKIGGILFQDTENPKRPSSRVTLAVFDVPQFVKMKGQQVAPQAIADLVKGRGKQIEKDIINMVLDFDKYKGQKRIPFDEFRSDVEVQVMKLEKIRVDSYAKYGYDNLGDNENYGEMETVIFNSPIEHGQKGHFSGDFTTEGLDKKEWELKQIPNTDKWAAMDKNMPDGVTADNIAEYVGTAGNKSEVEKWISDRNSESLGGINKGLFGHIRKWFNKATGVFNVAELQSDYYQKNKASELMQPTVSRDEIDAHMNINVWQPIDKEFSEKIAKDWGITTRRVGNVFFAFDKDGKDLSALEIREPLPGLERGSLEQIQVVANGLKEIANRRANDTILPDGKYQVTTSEGRYNDKQVLLFDTEKVATDFIKSYDGRFNGAEDAYNSYREQYFESRKKLQHLEEQKFIEKRQEELATKNPVNIQLKQFVASQKVHELRLLREAIKMAADEGAETVRFPDQYTLAVIEGYTDATGEGNAPYEIVNGDSDRLYEGDIIDYGGEKMVVVEQNRDTITVAPRDEVSIFNIDDLINDETNNRVSEIKYEAKRHFIDLANITREKLDSYEPDEWLGQDAKDLLTTYFEDNEDKETISWEDIEDDLYDEVEKNYQGMGVDDLVVWATSVWVDGDTIYALDGSNYENFNQPDGYEASSNEDDYYKNLSRDQKTVVDKYGELGKQFQKMRPDARFVEDDNGMKWLETSITEEDRSNPIVAFQEEGGKVKGAIDFTNDNRATLHIFDGADISTLAHEMSGHLGRRVLEKLAETNPDFARQYESAKKWAGVKDVWTTRAEERFARGFEKYLREGIAPTASLKEVFGKLKEWLTGIYRIIKGSSIDIELTDDVRRTFDSLLGKEQALPNQEAAFSVSEPNEVTYGVIGRVARWLNKTFGDNSKVVIFNSKSQLIDKANELGASEFAVIGKTMAANLENAEEVLARLDLAEQMTKANVDSNTIWQATGWQLEDGKWKYEIPDYQFKSDSQIEKDILSVLDGKEQFIVYNIKDVLDENLPIPNELLGAKFQFINDYKNPFKGEYDRRVQNANGDYEKFITINTARIDEAIREYGLDKDGGFLEAQRRRAAHSILIHEIQHAIQYEEGFALGGSPISKLKELEKSPEFLNALYRYQTLITEAYMGETRGRKSKIDYANKYISAYRDKITKEAVDWYEKLAGEAEARNVQNRSLMTIEERLSKSISQTNEIDEASKIYLYEEAQGANKFLATGNVEPTTIKVDGKDVKVKPIDVDVVNGFYSPLEKTINETKFDKLPAKQWSDKFGNSEEAKWTGLKDWLAQQQGSVSKADIQQYLKDNRISVVEVVKSDKITKEQYQEDAIKKGNEAGLKIDFGSENEIEIILPGEGYLRSDEVDTKLHREFTAKNYDVDISVLEIANELFNENKSKIYKSSNEDQVFNTKFSKHQLEGEKSNYKEVLVTMPNRELSKKPNWNEKQVSLNLSSRGDYSESQKRWAATIDGEEATITELPERGKYVLDYRLITNAQFDTFKEAEKYITDKQSQDRVKGKTDFKSSHFDEPNILVHLRMSDRIDSEGNKVLHLSEIQSDWGQQGKREGFKGKDKISEYDKVLRELLDQYNVGTENELNKVISRGDSNRLDRASTSVAEFDTNVPTAPFVTDTNQWVKLGLKMALKYGVKSGATKITWETGETQNDRYDLSKQVDDIYTSKYGEEWVGNKYEKRKDVEITLKGGDVKKIVVDETGKVLSGDFVGERLDNIVGKEMAEKIINAKEDTNFGEQDLKVGGTGMIGFYGSPKEGKLGIVGNVAKSLFKQEPKTVEIKTGEGKDTYSITTKDGRDIGGGWTKEQAEKWVSTEGRKADYYTIKIENNSNAQTTQHSIDITPELKAQVQQGLPMFMRSASGSILGFAHGNNVYLTKESLKSGVAVHEAGHLWLNWAEKNAPKHFEKGMQLVEGTAYLAKAKASEFYQAQTIGMDEAAKSDYMKREALAIAIGDKGEQMVGEAKRNSFTEWLNQLWDNIAKSLGLKNITAEELQNLTFDEFTKRVVNDILGEEQPVSLNESDIKFRNPIDKRYLLFQKVKEGEIEVLCKL